MLNKKRIILVSSFLIVFISLHSLFLIQELSLLKNSKFEEIIIPFPKRSINKINRTSLSIKGDSNLDLLAIEEGWPGDGSFKDPYQIQDYFFFGEGDIRIISIENTRKFVTIKDCYISSGKDYGIYLNNVSNIIISNSLVKNNSAGLRITNSINISVLNNVIISNGWSGISFRNTLNSTLEKNTISNNSNGCFAENSHNLIISANIFSENRRNGIFLMYSSNCLISSNDFLDNHSPDFDNAQGLDDGIFNNFSYNFWSDWITPDENHDGLVDNPYSLGGSSNNQDFHPYASALWVPSINSDIPDNFTNFTPSTVQNTPSLPLNTVIGIPLFILFLGLTIILARKQPK